MIFFQNTKYAIKSFQIVLNNSWINFIFSIRYVAKLYLSTYMPTTWKLIICRL